MQQPNNIQNVNRYSYVLNNPLNKTDPSGYFFQMLVVWAVQYVAAATATTAIGAALSAALTAYSYYGYAQMAIGAVKAIEGGGTAMANFAGGMAKGFAKGAIFQAVMGDASELGAAHAAERSGGAAGKTAAKPVQSAQGSTETDGHSHTASGQSSSAAGGYNQTSSLVDSDGWQYAGGADGGLNHGRYVTVGQRLPQSNFLLDFAAGLADNYTWGLSEDYTSANSNVNKGSSAYQLGNLIGLKGAGKAVSRKVTNEVRKRTFKDAQELVKKKRGPKGISRIYEPEQSVIGSQWEAHVGGRGSPALKQDGTWKHVKSGQNPPKLPRRTVEWLRESGWNI